VLAGPVASIPAQSGGGGNANILMGGVTRIGPSGFTSSGGTIGLVSTTGRMISHFSLTGYQANGSTSISIDGELGLLLVRRNPASGTQFGLAAVFGIFNFVRPSGDPMVALGGSAYVAPGGSPVAIVVQGASLIPAEGDPSPLLRVGLGLRL
jgi:hypothetical protein